jgi:hypothetical protein
LGGVFVVVPVYLAVLLIDHERNCGSIVRRTKMKVTCFAGAVVVLAALTAVAPTSLAQDKGKTEAAKLTSESQTALQTLYSTAPLAKELGPKARRSWCFPS